MSLKSSHYFLGLRTEKERNKNPHFTAFLAPGESYWTEVVISPRGKQRSFSPRCSLVSSLRGNRGSRNSASWKASSCLSFQELSWQSHQPPDTGRNDSCSSRKLGLITAELRLVEIVLLSPHMPITLNWCIAFWCHFQALSEKSLALTHAWEVSSTIYVKLKNAI